MLNDLEFRLLFIKIFQLLNKDTGKGVLSFTNCLRTAEGVEGNSW